MGHTLEQLNALPSLEARNEFFKCCGSDSWARRMVEQRPFVDVPGLFAKADENWWSLGAADWLEAFRSHPKIGEKKAEQAQSDDAKAWSKQEQSGISNAGAESMEALAFGNRAYEERFGYIFIVCATGKTSAEMLKILRNRLPNQPDDELRIAAEEQGKITQLRLRKLIEDN